MFVINDYSPSFLEYARFDLFSSPFWNIKIKHARSKNELQNRTLLNDASFFYEMVVYGLPKSKIYCETTMNMIPINWPEVIKNPEICACYKAVAYLKFVMRAIDTF